MFTRKIGKMLRGKITPLQIMMACVLGSMIGFVPGFINGPGLMITLILLLVILNANLGVALLIGSFSKLLGLALMPVSFAIGRVLLDGPTQGLFTWIINAPVLALYGFDHYATTGGMVMGLSVGILAGLLLTGAVKRFRLTMSNLEENSEAFKRLTNTLWSRTLMFIFIGGRHGKMTYNEMLDQKRGNPFRVAGVVFSVLVVGLLYVLSLFVTEPIVTAVLRSALERTNGATVDVQSANLDLSEGRLIVTGLAMADPNALETDIFRAARVEADVAGMDLLRKRLKLDRVVISEASSGETRAIPGRIVGPAPQPDDDEEGWDLYPEEKTIEEYIESYEIWKERLAQARRWLEKISGPGDDAETPSGETLSERLAREVALKGYARVTASHLIDGAPTLVVSELIAEGVRSSKLDDEVFDVQGTNLSTHPHLMESKPFLRIASRSGRILFESGSAEGGAGADRRLLFSLRGILIDDLAKNMAFGGEPPMRGGTLDIVIDGHWSEVGVGYLDLPMRVTLHDTNLAFGGSSASVDQFELAIGLRGPMDNPRIMIDPDLLADALVAAGADRLASELRGEADRLIEEATSELGDKLGEEVQNILGDALKGLLPGGKKKDDG